MIEKTETPAEVIAQQENVAEPAVEEYSSEAEESSRKLSLMEVPPVDAPIKQVEEAEIISTEESETIEQTAAQHKAKPKWRTWKEKIQGFIKKLFA